MKQRKQGRQVFYWDSTVFVAFFNAEPGGENVRELLDEAEAGEIFIITSSFTLVEVIKLKGKTPILVTEQDEITEFFKKDYFRFVDATRKVTEAARSLIWKSPGLWPKDAVHLASAIEFASKEKLDCIHSYDKDFLRLNGKLPVLCPVQEPMPHQRTFGFGVTGTKKGGRAKKRLMEIISKPPLSN
jgi:predicted nucleic acid-binding protein